jgi:hypothetical protein
MRQVLTFFIVVLLISACSQSSKETVRETYDTPAVRGKSYFDKSAQYPYQGMPPMAAAPLEQRDVQMAMMSDSIYSQIINDDKATWQQADAVYNRFAQNASCRQLLGYVILAQKNLIADNSTAAAERKKFYISMLVDTKYKGYMVLYYALKSLPASETEFTSKMAAAISEYGVTDGDAKGMKNFDVSVVSDPKQKQKFADVKLNFSYIDKFTTWQADATARR